MEDKRFHLQMIQNTINRMSSNSFIIKGWSLTAFGGLFTFYFANQNKNWSYNLLWLSLVCAIIFWGHDAYYLRIERQYRSLYNDVSNKDDKDIDFSMTPIDSGESLLSVAVRPILSFSYGIIVIASLALLYIFK
ncbi:hypothetical protein EFT58_07340 [Lactococcus lactis]|uniref:hypothetical protein n=1 Tax=Lactococcus lactis TaxID=1358 RepID=UPI0014561D92|nr:hypothetical protein [Lactococcus lactis]MCT2920406.1 hypothetical protein [Lactococcus lactis]NLS46824.1 hypothetical protein [Lactococcus lactis]